VDKVEQAVANCRVERHEDVDIAVGPEVVSDDRPEEGELGNLPFAAERVDGVAERRCAACSCPCSLGSIVASSSGSRSRRPYEP
jgi:hypothetical protein